MATVDLVLIALGVVVFVVCCVMAVMAVAMAKVMLPPHPTLPYPQPPAPPPMPEIKAKLICLPICAACDAALEVQGIDVDYRGSHMRVTACTLCTRGEGA